MTEHSKMKIAWDKLRNKFHFSEFHRHMNALGHVQSNSAITLTLQGTHCFHSSMNLRKKLNSFFKFTFFTTVLHIFLDRFM